jgi:hypothetical protein
MTCSTRKPLVAVGQVVELVQQGVGALQRDHPEDLGVGYGRRR